MARGTLKLIKYRVDIAPSDTRGDLGLANKVAVNIIFKLKVLIFRNAVGSIGDVECGVLGGNPIAFFIQRIVFKIGGSTVRNLVSRSIISS